MKKDLQENVVRCPRFVQKSAPAALGRTLFLIGLLLSFIMFNSLENEKNKVLYMVTVCFGIASSAAALAGVAAMLTALETVWIYPDEIRLKLGPLTLRRIPFARVRSIVSSVREVRLGMRKGDCDLYLLRVNVPGRLTLWMERTGVAAEALKKGAPDWIDLI